MANIAELAVQLTAKTGRFTSGMRGARAELSIFSKASSLLSTRLIGMASAAAGTVAAYVGVRSVLRSVYAEMQQIDKLAKLSDSLGISMEGLTQLEHAANLSGLSVEDLSTSLRLLQRNVVAASRGNEKAQGAFLNLGLSVSQLIKMRPEDQLLHIAESMQYVNNASMRTSIAMDLFGQSGSKILPLLQSGARGLLEMAQESDELGNTLSRVDAAMIEQANDQIDRMNTLLGGVKRTLAIEIAPIISAGAEAFLEWAKSGEGATAKINAALDSVAQKFGIIADKIQVAVNKTQELWDRLKNNRIFQTVGGMGIVGAKFLAGGGPFGLAYKMFQSLDSKGIMPKTTGIRPSDTFSARIKGWVSGVKESAKEGATAATAEAERRRMLNEQMVDYVRLLELAKERAKALAEQAKQAFQTGKLGTMAINTPVNQAITASIMRAESLQKDPQQQLLTESKTQTGLMRRIELNTREPVAIAG